jgi:hypothetical protein
VPSIAYEAAGLLRPTIWTLCRFEHAVLIAPVTPKSASTRIMPLPLMQCRKLLPFA